MSKNKKRRYTARKRHGNCPDGAVSANEQTGALQHMEPSADTIEKYRREFNS